jgi:hypothetical protein
MSSGVTLVAAGRDNPLNIDPDFTFFSTVFKRHTNFSSVIDRLNINTKPSNNGSSTSRFEIKGDLLSYVYLVCESPEKFTVNRDWSQVIDKVELFIGNQLVDTQYYEYSKKIAPDIQASSLSRSVKGPDGSTSSYFYPFKFFFCEDWASTIPLIALNYHDVEVVIHWADDVYGQLEVQAYLNLFANYWNTHFEDIRSAVSSYQAVTISATDEYTDVQANVLLYQSNIAALGDDQYTNLQANIVTYQNYYPNELNQLISSLNSYQLDPYVDINDKITTYQAITISSPDQYTKLQANIVTYQSSTNINDRIVNASKVVGGYNNLVPTPLNYESKQYNIEVFPLGPGSSDVFVLNGEQQPTLVLRRSSFYFFRYKVGVDSITHQIKLSTTPDGTHGGGTEYTDGAVYTNYNLSFNPQTDAPDVLYYYCANHSGMGGTINMRDGYSAPTSNLVTGFINYDGFADIETNLHASNTLNDFLTTKHNQDRVNVTSNILIDWYAIPSSNILKQNSLTGFLTYDGITDTSTNYDGSNLISPFLTAQGNEDRIGEGLQVVSDWNDADAIYNYSNTSPTADPTTGYLTYDGLTDDSLQYDASNSLINFISSNIASEILIRTTTVINSYTSLNPVPALSAPTSNATSGYLIWLGEEDALGTTLASSNLSSYMDELHYSNIFNAAANVITSYEVTALSNILIKDSTTGFLTFDDNTEDSTSAYPSSNALYDYMAVKHFEPRSLLAQGVVDAWNTANAVYSFSNTAPSFGSDGFILYDATQDDGTQYDGSNSLVTFSNVEENVVRIANATALVNGYSNLIIGISNPKAVPTYDEDTGFITFDGDTDVTGSNVGSTALYTYVENYGQTILGYSFDLFTRYIYIDKDERRITADRSVDYVITQTQRIPASNKKEIELPLSHPVSFIASTASNFNDTNNMLLEINGEPIGESKPAIPHYRHVSTYFHSPYGSNQNTTMMYPFCLDASKKEPSGSLNFSRLDSARIILDEAINGDIYAVNYNILRISNGVGGLLYA